MSSYRDERDALRSRLDSLERELAELREGPDREEAKRQLAELSAKVAEATDRLEGERTALGEVAESIQKLRTSLGAHEKPEEAPAAKPSESPTSKTSGMAAGTWAFLGIAACVLPVGFLILQNTSSSRSPDPSAALAGVPGAPHAVDPTALLPAAREKALVRHSLMSIEARYVGSNGLVDLKAKGYRASVTYTFGENPPEPPPDPSLPLGAPRPSRPLPRQARVVLDMSGLNAESIGFGYAGDAVPDPKCSLADVWRAAREAGAPEGAVAIVTYKRDPLSSLSLFGRRDLAAAAKSDSGVAWLFKIEGTKIELRIEDPTCKVFPPEP